MTYTPPRILEMYRRQHEERKLAAVAVGRIASLLAKDTAG